MSRVKIVLEKTLMFFEILTFMLFKEPVWGSIPTSDVRAGVAPRPLALHRVCAAASSGKCVVARTGPWLEPGSPDDTVSRLLSI